MLFKQQCSNQRAVIYKQYTHKGQNIKIIIFPDTGTRDYSFKTDGPLPSYDLSAQT